MLEDRTMGSRAQPDVVRAFFSAMNDADADAAADLVSEGVQIEIGPHRLAGRSAVRELALQADDQLAFETVPLELEAEGDTVVVVRARRTQRWRSSGEVAAEEELLARFTFDADGTIAKVALG